MTRLKQAWLALCVISSTQKVKTMFKTKTVDSAISALNRAYEDLRTVSAQLSDKEVAKRNAAAKLSAEADSAQAEAARANRIAERVKALVA